MKKYTRVLENTLFWSVWQRWLCTVSISFVLLAGWYMLCYQPLKRRIDLHMQEYKTAQQEASLVQELERNITELRAITDKLKTQSPIEQVDNFSFEQFFKKAQKYNLVLEKFAMLPEQTLQQNSSFPFECSLTGDFFKLQQFLDDIATISVLSCHSCTLTKRDDKTIVCHYKGSLVS